MDKLKSIVFEIDKGVIFAMLLLLVISKETFLWTLSLYSGIFIKIVVVFQLYVFRDEVMRVLKELWYLIPRFEFHLQNEHTQYTRNTHAIDGIDTNKLVDYMFET